MVGRWKGFLNILFMGIPPEIPEEMFAEVEKDWPSFYVKTKQELIAKIERRATSKRQSMDGNATRGSYKFTGIAFIIAAAVAIMLAPETGVAAQILFKVCISIMLLGSGLLLIVISAKGKVMRRELNAEPTAITMAKKALETQRYYRKNPKMRLWFEYKEIAETLHKCEMILLAERRGAWLVSTPGVVAVIVMVVAMCLA